jgi:hypothetical protein
VFQNVAGPRSFLHATEKASTLPITATVFYKGGKPGREAFVKARYDMRRIILQVSDIYNRLKNGVIRPDVRTVQISNLKKFNIFSCLLGIPGGEVPHSARSRLMKLN